MDKKLQQIFRRLTHDVVIIGRPGAKAPVEVAPLQELNDVVLNHLLYLALTKRR